MSDKEANAPGVAVRSALNAVRSAGLWILCVLVLVVAGEATANDIRITNFLVHPHSSGNGEVEFDLAWDNSWRVVTEPFNWDAAWVFCKIRRNGGNWEHVKLSTTGHTIPSTPQAITTALGLVDPTLPHNASTNPAMGIFLYRTNDGFGTFTANDMRLRWSYADNGVSAGDTIEIRVLAIEMVYVPDGGFYAGDSATSTAAFREKETTDNDPWSISSESAITTTSGTSGNYYYPGGNGLGGDGPNSVFTIPAAFPKGYGAFYVMKGEISQSQWVAFFNMLTTTQKSTRDITSNINLGKNTDDLSFRNNVSWTTGDATLPDRGAGATYAGVAMNYMSWADLTAYLDWAGLRPMSELEYEKAARGPKAAVSGEYAWGSTVITQATSLTNAGLTNERAQSGSQITFGYAGGVQGPVRAGSFAQGVVTREGSGAGFYGALELSGNVRERSVTVGKSSGRVFEGRYHGDGTLDANGNPNVATWPAATTAEGSGYRGGDWVEGAVYARLSDRSYTELTNASRDSNLGGRGVRSAPEATSAVFRLGGSGNEQRASSSFLSDGSGALVASFTSDLTFTCAGTVAYDANLPFVLVKLGADLNCTWVKRLPSNIRLQPQVSVLNNGDLLVMGTTLQSVDFGDGVTRNPAGDGVTYIIRFNGQTGSVMWYRDFVHGNRNESWVKASRMLIEPDQQAFLVRGSYQTSINFGGGVLTPVDSLDVVLARFSTADGSHLWSAMYTGGGPQDLEGFSLMSDALTVSGAGRGSVALGGACGTVSWTGGGRGSLLANFARDGQGFSCTWVVTTDATCGETWGHGVLTDNQTNIYQTGIFCGTKTFSGVTMTATTGNRSTFIASYTSAAGSRWANGGNSWNTFRSLELFPQLVSGYVLAAHNPTSSPNYGNGLTQEINGASDSFLLKIDAGTGVVTQMYPIAASGAQSTFIDVVTADGAMVLSGTTDADLTISAYAAVTGVQSNDVFVARIANPLR